MNRESDYLIESAFNLPTAVGLIAVQWRFKEQALKYISKNLEEKMKDSNELDDTIMGTMQAINLTSSDKVLKVFSACISLFNILISKVED